VASGSDDGTVKLWEGRSGQLLDTLKGHAGVIYGIALSNDGRLAASCGDDGMVRLWRQKVHSAWRRFKGGLVSCMDWG
jgi:WD40 repeat protein